ncbi:MAG: hypothetical protein AAGG02_11145 [Cyanobacteria bacterium P01_H01_bin.15]
MVTVNRKAINEALEAGAIYPGAVEREFHVAAINRTIENRFETTLMDCEPTWRYNQTNLID